MTIAERQSAIVEVRGLPAQAIAAVEIAEQLTRRGYDVTFVASAVPQWFADIHPEIAAQTIRISDKRVQRRHFVRSIWLTGRASLKVLRCGKNKVARMGRFQLHGVTVGDLILDSAIARGGARASWWKMLGLIIRYALISEQVLYTINDLVWERSTTLIVTSSRSYASVHGLLCRFGHERGLSVLNSAPTFVAFTQRDPDKFRPRTRARPDVHDYVRFAGEDLKTRRAIEQFISGRFSIQSPNPDYRRASRAGLRLGDRAPATQLAALNRGSHARVIFIAPHVFSDAVHMAGPQLFRNYLHWFISTLRYVQRVPSAVWMTKSHPAAGDYGEEDLVRECLDKFDRTRRIVYLDSQTPPSDILDASDAVVTVRGTVAMEFGINGKPALLAGSMGYSHLGFTVSPMSRRQYFDALSSLANEPLPPVNSFAASAALYYFERQLISANLAGSAFSVDAVDLRGEDWDKLAQKLEEVRKRQTDPFLTRISRVLESDHWEAAYE